MAGIPSSYNASPVGDRAVMATDEVDFELLCSSRRRSSSSIWSSISLSKSTFGTLFSSSSFVGSSSIHAFSSFFFFIY
jgi:hypothetical protein